MKLLHLLLLFCFLSFSYAQRRPVQSDASESPRPIRRGRTRFTVTSEQPPTDDGGKQPEVANNRRVTSRRRPAETVATFEKRAPETAARDEKTAETPEKALETVAIFERKTPETAATFERKSPETAATFEKKSPETAATFERRHPEKASFERRAPEKAATFERRAKPPRPTESSRKTYEVEEVVDETPLEASRKLHKPRVVTENKFEAQNAPPPNALFQPSTTVYDDELSESIGSGVIDGASSTTASTLTGSDEIKSAAASEISSSSELPKIENEIVRETTRVQPETTAATTRKASGRDSARRVNVRSRNGAEPRNEEASTQASRGRVRTRTTRRPVDDATTAASRAVGTGRGARRRPEATTSDTPTPRTRVPPVLEAAGDLPSRSRTGRKINGRRSEAPEKITLDLPPNSRRVGSNRRNPESADKSGRKSSEARSRSRTRELPVTPPTFDEQKLEVLPLFEGETKTVRTPLRKTARRRTFNSAEDGVETSATEDNVKLVHKPETNEIVSRRQSVVVETRTESSYRKAKQPRKPVVKESVVSEVSEVTSKRTVTRKSPSWPKPAQRIKVDEPKVSVSQVVTTSRGKKKSEASPGGGKSKKSGLTSSEEDIGDANYPEPFKALIQAKKQQGKESRTALRAEKVVSAAPTAQGASEAASQVEDVENELEPKPTKPSLPKSTRRRPSQPPTRPQTRPSSTSPTRKTLPLAKEHKFHAKFNSPAKAEQAPTPVPAKSGRSFSPKPPRGLYSSKKNVKESYSKNTRSTGLPTQVTPGPAKKSSRYSSRYRSDSSRSAIRTSTNAPAYLPTIPTITPPTTLVKSSIASQDKDLGLDVITFDDPVNTIPSANLVSADYVAPSADSDRLTSPSLVSASQTKTTEKPVSIIERIINSITAISTTEASESSTRPTPAVRDEPTKSSAILKLATKKPTKPDKTVPDKTTQTSRVPKSAVTSERPTTIIERILSSLSAIQADTTTTDSDALKSTQVGTNFNTISSSATTPMSRVTKSTLTAQISTSVNPLSVLDEIENEQTLQKRTIGKLLVLLNTLTSTSASPVVVVTPKVTSFVTGASPNPLSLPPATTTTTTEIPTNPTTQLFTSTRSNPGIQPSVSLSARIRTEEAITTTNTPEFSSTRLTTTPTVTTLRPETTPAEAAATPISTNTVPSTPGSTTTSNEILSTAPETTTLTTTTPGDKSTTTDLTNDLGVLPLFLQPNVTSLVTDSTPSANSDTEPTVSFGTTTIPSFDQAFDTETVFGFPSTIPPLINFEVSPGSVSVFSANDLSNAITPDDALSTTVTISSRANFPETVATTQSTSTTESTIGTGGTESTTSIPDASLSTVGSTTSATTETSVPSANSLSGVDSTTVPSATTPIPSANPLSNVVSTTAASITTDTVPSANPLSSADSTTIPSEITTSVPNANFLSNAASTTTPSATTQTAGSDSSTLSSTDSAVTTTLAATSEPISTTNNPVATTAAAPASNNTTEQDVSSNVIDTTGTPEPSNQTSTTDTSSSTNNSARFSNRSGRLLNVVQEPVQNSIESTTLDKDYFIFAVLNNNTILRKRPSKFPNKETPFLIVGVYPNNTIVKKFPNGTLVPMEPIIRVSGFDTRQNPPPLPEITSNQVTPDQGGRPDNPNLQTVDQNTISPVEPNLLSISSTGNENAVTAESSTARSSTQSSTGAPTGAPSSTPSSSSSSTLPSTTQAGDSVASSTSATRAITTTAPITLPTLTEILNGRTVQAFNSIINISDLVQTLDVDPKKTITTTVLPTTVSLSNRILESATTNPPPTTTPTTTTTTTNTVAPTTTQTTTTTEIPTTTVPATTTTARTTRAPSTVLPLSLPATVTSRSTTIFPSTTFFPTFLTTLFSTLQPRRFTTTPPPRTTLTTVPTTIGTTPQVGRGAPSEDLVSASTTTRAVTTVAPTTTRLTTTTTVATTTTQVPTTTTQVPTTTSPPFTSPRAASSTKTPRQLTQQQLKDLQTLAELEKEQASILKQLAFLTNLNNVNTKTTTDRNSLANRIIALAIERDKERNQQPTSESSRQGKKLESGDDKNSSLDELVNHLTPAASPYGNSNDAIIAALLKEQGIGPPTPKDLEDVYIQTTTARPTTTTTKKPRPTTRAPGPLMQSLNWLLNALAPTTPKPKPKKRPAKANQEELLTHQPTRITPVITAAPPQQNSLDSLSQDDIKALIQQLEGIQKNPSQAETLDLSSVKSLQSLLGSQDGVQVSSPGTTGATPRPTTPLSSTTEADIGPIVQTRGRSSTALPLSVSNSIADEDDEEPTTTSWPKVSLPPVKLKPVPGIEESDNLVRGQLISAAVNVTRAISQFLGSALQDAAQQFTRLFSNATDYAAASSFLPNLANISALSNPSG